MKQKRSAVRPPLVRLVGWQAGEEAPATATTTPTIGHRLAPGIASAAAVAATGLLGPAALAAPGDLDPTFADVGRWSGPNLDGSLWSLDVQDDNATLFAGTDEYCGYYDSCSLADFTGRLLASGTLDTGFAAAALDGTAVYDTALQSDGKVVGVGFLRQPGTSQKLQVFRLLPNGTLDSSFGLGGLALVVDPNTSDTTGRSVIVEPDGRIVIAGERGADLLVVRLLANGALDPGFGIGGVYVGSGDGVRAGRVVRAPGGGYRTMAMRTGPTACRVYGLTEAGVLDAGFGTDGVAVATAEAQHQFACDSLAMDASGRLLLGGTSLGASGNNGYVTRMLANGTQDAGFSAAPISAQFSEVTALTVGPAGSIFVAGRERTGLAGATVVRMLADGTLDPLYGRAGSSRIELNTPRFSLLRINDMRALGNDALVVGGSYQNDSYRMGPFVARLLGNAAGGGPGVLSVQQDRALATEQAGKATVSVRRIGGRSGAIAVSYVARDLAAHDLAGRTPASRGQDYTAVAGRLTWADGDDSAREIVVPIASDALAEPSEYFELALDAPEGGAGLGTYGTEIEIAPEGYPAGQLTISGPGSVPENQVAVFAVDRGTYAVGTVTVTVRVAGGSATPGQDFASAGERTIWRDVLVTFLDGERTKAVAVWIADVDKKESRTQSETFTLEIVSPTGGAAIGSQTKVTAAIEDVSSNSSGGSGGGGALGWFATLLLGLGGGLRRLLAGDRRQRLSA